ncbi:MAG: hypothetical protein IKS17_02485 [Firmicutes bacterium]|nr:hypothetical protein [Bacillota bacterium]
MDNQKKNKVKATVIEALASFICLFLIILIFYTERMGYKLYIFGLIRASSELAVWIAIISRLSTYLSNYVMGDAATKKKSLNAAAALFVVFAIFEAFCLSMSYHQMKAPKQVISNPDDTEVFIMEYTERLLPNSPEYSYIKIYQKHNIFVEELGTVDHFDFSELSPLENGMCSYSYDHTRSAFTLYIKGVHEQYRRTYILTH